MITILSLKDRIRKGQILQTVQGAENNAEVLVMSDGGNELGYVLIDVKSSVVRILKMMVCGYDDLSKIDAHSRMCVDSMMRASASYGATVGAYQIESELDSLGVYFSSVGFEYSNGKWIDPLINIVKICHN